MRMFQPMLVYERVTFSIRTDHQEEFSCAKSSKLPQQANQLESPSSLHWSPAVLSSSEASLRIQANMYCGHDQWLWLWLQPEGNWNKDMPGLKGALRRRHVSIDILDIFHDVLRVLRWRIFWLWQCLLNRFHLCLDRIIFHSYILMAGQAAAKIFQARNWKHNSDLFTWNPHHTDHQLATK